MIEFDKALKNEMKESNRRIEEMGIDTIVTKAWFRVGAHWAKQWFIDNSREHFNQALINGQRARELEAKLEKAVEYLEECNSKLKVPEPFMVAEIKERGE